MAVIHIPPDKIIYYLNRIHGNLHVYNTGNPPGAATGYSLTIVNVHVWSEVHIGQGYTNTYPAEGNAVYIQNNGPSMLQVIYVEKAMTVEETGGHAVKEFPVHGASAVSSWKEAKPQRWGSQ